MIEIECPACDQAFIAQEEQLGTIVLCPHCAGQVDLTGELPLDDAALQAEVPVAAPEPRRQVVVRNRQTTSRPHTQVISTPPPQHPPPPHPSAPPRPAGAPVQPRGPMPVVITDVKLTIGQMCVLTLKWMIACIPAIIVMWIIMGLVALLFSGVIAGIFAAASNSPGP